MEYNYEMKMPKDRVGVLIGKNGEIKKRIEKATNVKLDIDSKEGDVTITGEEGLDLYAAKEIIKAISRGFNPDFALRLLKTDYVLEMFDIKSFANTSNAMIRLKGRVIGSEGKSRRILESLTETSICIYGKTVGILGESQNVALARKAVESLLKGSRHSGVYKWLEKKCKEMRRMEKVGLGEEDLTNDKKIDFNNEDNKEDDIEYNDEKDNKGKSNNKSKTSRKNIETEDEEDFDDSDDY